MKKDIINTIYMKNQKGFTLVEILITIAIIAILASVILVNVSLYTGKGKDAALKENAQTLMTVATGYYDSNQSYLGFCESNTAVKIKNAMPLEKNCNVAEDGLSYTFCAQLTRDMTNAWCVDSRGVKKEINNEACTSLITACP